MPSPDCRRALLLAAALTLGLSGCGQKGPLTPPKAAQPVGVHAALR
ncbi:MAG: lipoprotein [Burkholderiales bacterium]|nr:lipoprotein [Pseudomonadota bacterium]MCC7067531.1 lipoprotein [Burkholderiales bacterium]